MRLLVTGGTGYLGTELAARARASGFKVEAPGSRQLDVRDEAAVKGALEALRPDVVVNAAYRQDTEDMWEVNAEGAAMVARATAGRTRLLHLSTDVVFDGVRGRYTEEDSPSPVTDYGRSKAKAEELVRRANPAALVVRTSLLYGGAAPSKHELAARDPDKTFFTDELRCPAQVGDVAAALLELARSHLTGLLHAAGADAVSRCEFARLVAGQSVPCAAARELGIVRPLDCTLDSTRARGFLETRLRGVHEVLRA